MSIDHSPSRPVWVERAALGLALTLVTLGTRLPILLHQHAIDDEVNYAVVARVLMSGGRLYADAVERRPPLTFWLYETIGRENWAALHLVGVAWVLATMLALGVLATRLFGRRAGVAAALLYAVVQPWGYWGNLAFNGEVLMNLPVAAAYAVCLAGSERRRARALVAGALIAMAFLLKQPAAIAVVPLAAYVLDPGSQRVDAARRWRARLGDLVCLGLGAAFVVGNVALWLGATGVLREAVYWSVTDHDVPHVFWGRGLVHTAAFLLECLPVLLAAAWTARQREVWDGRWAERRALVGLVMVSAVGVAASGRFFPHYYIGLLPSVVVLAAPAFARLTEWPMPHWPRRVSAGVACAWVAGAAFATVAVQMHHGVHEAPTTDAGRYLRAHSSPDDRLFIWGRIPVVYLDADRQPAARYIDTFALTGRIFGPDLPVDTTARIVPGAWAQLRADFAAHPPAFILDTQAHPDDAYPVARFPWLATLLRDEYVPVEQVSEGTVYRRRHAVAAAVD